MPGKPDPSKTNADESLGEAEARVRRIRGAAKRALAEAEARRAEIDAKVEQMPEEINGRDGPEPVRYGDWEKKGIASDF